MDCETTLALHSQRYTHRLTFVINRSAVTSFTTNKCLTVLFEILATRWHVDFNFLNGKMLAWYFLAHNTFSST